MKPTPASLALGSRIRHARACRGFSRRAVAAYCAVTEKTLTMWECGKALPSDMSYGPLSRALVVDENLLRAGGDGWVRLTKDMGALDLPGTSMDMPDRLDQSSPQDHGVDVFRPGEELQLDEAMDQPPPSPPTTLPRMDDAAALWWREHFRKLDRAMASLADDD